MRFLGLFCNTNLLTDHKMKITLPVPKEFEIKTLHVKAEVYYWGEAQVDGVDDTDGTLIPCRDGDYWVPEIDAETGQIRNWKQGVTAYIYYNVFDEGSYEFKDGNGNRVYGIEGSVPPFMCPGVEGYGDCIIMYIDDEGFIENWKISPLDFK